MSDEPITAPDSIFINGALAFAPGDPVPAGHAEALGLTGANPPEGPINATADETGITGVGVGAGAGKATVSDVYGDQNGPPYPSAPKPAWVDYAVSQGLGRDEAEAATKAELVEQYGSTEGD